MKRILSTTILFCLVQVVLGQTTIDLDTVRKKKTTIKSSHNFGLNNPVIKADEDTDYTDYDIMTFIDHKDTISKYGAAFKFYYTNSDGESDFDGYVSGAIGGYKSNGTYSSGVKSACGMPVQIKDLTHSLRIKWETNQTNANDSDDTETTDVNEEDKWWATINVIFDAGDENAEPVSDNRDYDLVIQNVSYKQDDFENLTNTSGRYWKFAKNSDNSTKYFSLFLNGTEYKWAVRYKFFNYPSGHDDYHKNDKVHVKFIPEKNNSPIPRFNHSLKAFIDCSKDYMQYARLTESETTLAQKKIATDTLWIKSLTAGYEIYSGESTLENVHFLTTIDNTKPNTLTGFTAIKVDSDSDGVYDKVDLSWTATNESANERDIYSVYRSTDNEETYTVISTNLTTNSFTDTDIIDGTKYIYYVTIKDHSYNESDKSTKLTIQLGDAPNAEPSNLSATASTTNCSQVSLTWTDNSNNEDGFRIRKSTDGTTYTEVLRTAANATSCTVTGLGQYKLYV
ncbi:fibronectin type III domain-containing protein [Pseudofulvibacter geojedonensis]|uniref:Fibronectin type III domain-containing protein n=1 Tax=Pseudofulvibacter geojedonensis TaxID=1123758 RepID=A0ABW3HZ95_9FLAO